jgi:[ribosomal protein S18]-alanine N-acetyltransferase
MPRVAMKRATDEDRVWAATVMSASEPWITLGRTFEACLRSCQAPGDDLYLAWLGGERCALALVRERGVAGAPYLVSIAVADTHRSLGLGFEVLAFVEGLFRGRHRHLFLCVSSFNTRARTFYERHGFHAVGLLPDFIIDGSDEVLMAKKL